MIIKLDPDFYPQYKKQNIRIKKQFDKSLELFEKNPMESSLDNHPLVNEWLGFRAIHIGDRKNDYLAVYKEIRKGKDIIARFVALGTHKELFG